jgi:IMP dehydrogenase
MLLTYDDVLILPQFSEINSRKDVDVSSFGLKIPVISANMDSVTGPNMAHAMTNAGGVGCLHRFADIKENINLYKNSPKETWVSIGMGELERERAAALAVSGAYRFIIDVAHGAQQQVVDQAKWLLDRYDVELIVGNFATASSVEEFLKRSKGYNITAFKVGIGPGAACTTRIKTGVGMPQFSAVKECAKVHYVIADGGIKSAGDVVKALAAGAEAVMVGKMLAQTEESAAPNINGHKTYRGSASQESYAVQNKLADWRTAEGVSGHVKVTSTVKDVMQDIEGGIRSAFTYVGASNIREFREKAVVVQVSSNTALENGSRL